VLSSVSIWANLHLAFGSDDGVCSYACDSIFDDCVVHRNKSEYYICWTNSRRCLRMPALTKTYNTTSFWHRDKLAVTVFGSDGNRYNITDPGTVACTLKILG
jgi:hypothetical protein